MTDIPLRCLCGNAVIRPALDHEIGAKEVVTNLCLECDSGGGFEEIWYTTRDDRTLSYAEWMDERGLEP